LTPIPRWLGVALLVVIATSFGSNHIAARVAFDHGASVAAAVVSRSCGTALAVLALLLVLRVPLKLPKPTARRAILIGAVLAFQSYCIYSAVARMPVAIALLVFNTYPMLYALMTWAAGMEHRPPLRALLAMPTALFGLALALDVVGGAQGFAQRWTEVGVGALFAFAASLAFATVLLLGARWMHGVDGRLRTCVSLASCGAIALAGAAASGTLVLPADATGWLGLGLLTLFYGSSITSLFVLQPRMRYASDAVALNFEPVAVLFLGWVILGQNLTFAQLAGAAVVIGCIIAIATAKR
jgi:drug/metabolite transporter (DMT)-like permease